MVDAGLPSSSTIYIVENDEDVAETLRLMLAAAGYDSETYASAEEFLESVALVESACLVIDIMLPGMDGIELSRSLADRGMHFPAVFITGLGSIRMAVDAMKAGAVDVLEKPFGEQDLIDAITRALGQNGAESGQLVNDDEVLARIARLTPREREVLDLVIAGQSNKMMARSMGISPRTVEIYRARVMDKMRARNVADLVRLSVAAGVALPNT